MNIKPKLLVVLVVLLMIAGAAFNYWMSGNAFCNPYKWWC